MTTKTKKKVALFFRYLTRLGFAQGLRLYVILHLIGSDRWFRTAFLKHPVRLRSKTTDLATFDQIFVGRIYNLPVKSTPKFIIDCGANVGMASIYFANRFPSATIVSIEPEQSNFDALTSNCRAYTNIHVLKKAVWPVAEAVEVVDTGIGHYGFTVRKTNGSRSSVPTAVETITLEEVMKLYGATSIDLLKIDIEGGERELFSQETEYWLSRTRLLTIEVHDRFAPGASTAIIKALAKFDFSVAGSHEGFFCEQQLKTN